MSKEGTSFIVHTNLWSEEPEPGNPFSTRAAYCRGYDVYGELIGQARWVEMLYLLFRGERPAPQAAALMESLAVALANPGPRDLSVHAAMCAGVGGSTAAASLIAALSVGAGQFGGARDIHLAMNAWQACGNDLQAWQRWLRKEGEHLADIWPEQEHAPGFDPHATSTTTPVKQALAHFASLSPGQHLRWLATHRQALEAAAGLPLALTCVAAAALADLQFTPDQGELLYLLLRLPGAAAHALEQRDKGHKNFPLFELDLEDDPAGTLA